MSIESLGAGSETTKHPSFEEQWANPVEIKIGNKTIPVQDIFPEKLKTEVPMIIGMGWSETPDAHKGNIKIMSDLGRRVISPEAPHGVETEARENYPTIELRKMAALIETLEAQGVEKADLVGRSEGAIFSVMAAYLYPERFRNLVLINPAGMIGEDNVGRLAVGFSGDLVKQIINESKKKKADTGKADAEATLDALGGVKTLAKDPLRAIQSIFAISNSDIREMLIAIRKKGIGISVIAGVNDGAFPMEKMQEALGLEHVDGFYSTTGSHNSYFLDRGPYSRLIDNALDALENRPKKNPSSSN
jgi:pimeloyl-ACP methyl ester carboxylesterase